MTGSRTRIAVRVADGRVHVGYHQEVKDRAPLDVLQSNADTVHPPHRVASKKTPLQGVLDTGFIMEHLGL
jgi:hypothetical protein